MFCKLKESIYGKKVFVIEGNPNTWFKCGTALGRHRGLLRGHISCYNCYKGLTGLENQFFLVEFGKILQKHNQGHLKKDDISNQNRVINNIVAYIKNLRFIPRKLHREKLQCISKII